MAAVNITTASGDTNNITMGDRVVFRTSGGDIYAVIYNSSDGAISVWKSGDAGATWAEKDAGNRPATDVKSCAGAMDSGGDIHILYGWLASGNPDHYEYKYVIFDTGTDTYGTPEVAHDFDTDANSYWYGGIAVSYTHLTLPTTPYV